MILLAVRKVQSKKATRPEAERASGQVLVVLRSRFCDPEWLRLGTEYFDGQR